MHNTFLQIVSSLGRSIANNHDGLLIMKVTIGHTFFSMAISRGVKLDMDIRWSLGFINTYQDSLGELLTTISRYY